MLRGTEGVRFLGKDRQVLGMLSGYGLPADELVVDRVMAGDKIIHVIGLTNKVWNCPALQVRLKSATASLGDMGYKCAAIPQTAIEAKPWYPNYFPGSFLKILLRHVAGAEPFEHWCHAGGRHDPIGCFAITASTGRACTG